MATYIIFKITVLDPEKLKAYQSVAPSIINQFEGKLIARSGEVVALEGAADNRITVILEFPSMEKAKSFYNSPEYIKAIALRNGAAEFEAFAVEGLG